MFNIILPLTLWSSKWSISLRFSPPKPCIYPSSTPYALHAPPISFFSISSYKQYLVSSTDHSAPHYVVFSTPVTTTSFLGPKILLNTLFSDTLSLRTSVNVSDQVSHPYKTTGKIIVLYILIFIFLDSQLECKIFCT